MLPNFTETYLFFDDVTIVIKSNTIFIHINDIITNSVEEAHYIAFEKALRYSKSLIEVGLICENLVMDQAHYARVESNLSKFLWHIDKRYFILLDDGSKFWIDTSDKLEDETTSSGYRERLDEFMKDLDNSKAKISDVDNIMDDLDKMKEIFKEQSKLVNNFILLEEAKINTNIQDKYKKDLNYFG